MHAIVHAADIQDRDGGVLLMATLFGLYPFFMKLYADGGYQRPAFQEAMRKVLRHVNVEIVRRGDQAKAFVVLPKRWIVERPQSQGARLPQARLNPPYAANWSSRASSASCLRMYSLITASSRTTVETKYPLAQKCCPTKLRFRSP